MKNQLERYSESVVIEAICRVLYQRPITAKYAGQAVDTLAARLDKQIPRANGLTWSRSVVSRYVNVVEDRGLVKVTPPRAEEPTRQVLREIRYTGVNPDLIEWAPAKPEPKTRPKGESVTARLDRLERQMAFVLVVLGDLGAPIPSFDQSQENNPS